MDPHTYYDAHICWGNLRDHGFTKELDVWISRSDARRHLQEPDAV